MCILWMHSEGITRKKKPSYTVEALTIDSTQYGYIIKQNERVFIVQSFIPGTPGKLHFQSPDDAIRVGELVAERLKAEINFSITPKDLESLGVLSFTSD